MKKIFNILAVFILLSSCSSFLEEKNKAGINNDDLYKTKEGYQTLRVNAYSTLRNVFQEGPLILFAGTDVFQMPRGMNANGIYDYTNLNHENGDVTTFYKNCYNAIQQVNTAIYYLDIADISEEDKALYLAEYNFLLGFYHFILIEQFGGIVLNDAYTKETRINMPRSSLDESYTFVIEKLNNALSGSLSQTKNDGSICKDIVNHYLAKVYLTRGWDLGDKGDFKKAKEYAQAVMNSRGDLKYTMENLWSPSNENNDEVIFAIQYSDKSLPNTTSGNNQEALFGPYLGGTERNHKYMSGDFCASWSVHSWFDKDDARYEATFMLTLWEYYYDYYNNERNIPGKNAITAVFPRAWDKAEEMFNDYLKLTNGEKNGQFVRTSMNDENGQLIPGVKEFIKKWVPDYFNVDPINALDKQGKNYLVVYPFIEHSSQPLVNETYWRTAYNNDFAQPGIKKFDMSKLVNFHTRQSYRDIVLASLSETMLLYAEACIGDESYSEAEQYINKVLQRPGNSKSGSTLACSLPNNQKEALEVYLKESAKELMGQYCGRWPELRRTKMLSTMFYKYNYDYTSGLLGKDPIGAKTYRPIPLDAIEINEGLSFEDQNPGYY